MQPRLQIEKRYDCNLQVHFAGEKDRKFAKFAGSGPQICSLQKREYAGKVDCTLQFVQSAELANVQVQLAVRYINFAVRSMTKRRLQIAVCMRGENQCKGRSSPLVMPMAACRYF